MNRLREQKPEAVETEKKKMYLSGYRRHNRRMKKIAAELEEIRYIKDLTFAQGEMGRQVSGHRERMLYADRLKDQERRLYHEGAKEVELHKEIALRIEELEDEDERDVLFYRYMKGMEFFKIAEAMNYSERQIHRIHGKALENFAIPGEACSGQRKESEGNESNEFGKCD